MFTGIIEKTGVIKTIKGNYFTIEVNDFLDDIKLGDSIAINGVCTTVLEFTTTNFKVEIMPETLKVTNFIDLKEGNEVNLERSLKVGERLDGHFVLGHVDGIGEVLEIKEDGDYIELVIITPEKLRKYITYKGTIALNGISLTISEDINDKFKVSLITHTREITNLKNIKIGDKVNLEVDVIARYMEKIITK